LEKFHQDISIPTHFTIPTVASLQKSKTRNNLTFKTLLLLLHLFLRGELFVIGGI
jgi:hypothetical protein